MKEESWALDIDDVRDKKAQPDTVRFDALTGELWVGLIRSEKPGVTFKADITFQVAGIGTWEWKGVGEPFQSEARGPDRK